MADVCEFHKDTLAKVEAAVDDIGSLADAKVFLKKLARVVYWLAKNAEE